MKETLLVLLLALIATSQINSAQAKNASEECTEKINNVAKNIPDLSKDPDAANELGLNKEQLQAALAALDAARIVNYDDSKCDTMVSAAEEMLKKGGQSPR